MKRNRLEDINRMNKIMRMNQVIQIKSMQMKTLITLNLLNINKMQIQIFTAHPNRIKDLLKMKEKGYKTVVNRYKMETRILNK